MAFAHHSLAWSYIRAHSTARDRPGNFTLSDAVSEFASSGCDTLFLSSEDFLTCTSYEGFLPSFFTELRSTFDQVIVCAYVRDRKGFFTASYNQWVKALVYDSDFDTYLEKILAGNQAPIHYTRSLTQWSQFADTVRFLPLTKNPGSESVEERLLNSLGISKTRPKFSLANTVSPVNSSIGPRSVLAYRTLRQLLAKQDWFDPSNLNKREALLEFLHSASELNGWNQERLHVFDKSKLQKVREYFQEDDEYFADQFFEHSWGETFPNEAIADIPNELQIELLNSRDRDAIEEFVNLGFQSARAIYCPTSGTVECISGERQASPQTTRSLWQRVIQRLR